MHTPLRAGTIVVGVDGSPSADLALDWAANQASLDHAALTLVNASDRNGFWTGPAVVGLDDLLAARRQAGRALLEEAVTRVAATHPGLVVHQLQSDEDPREALLGLAGDAAMIVLGSHGRGPVRSLLLGSVGVAVSRLAGCPVVVVRPQDATPTRHGVLVGLDDAGASHPALEFAYRLAAAHGWPLTVLHCFQDHDLSEADRLRSLAGRLESLTAKFPDLAVQLSVHEGFLDERLVQLSPEMHVVVVGAARSSRLQRVVYGSLAPTVVEHARSVVAVVPVGR